MSKKIKTCLIRSGESCNHMIYDIYNEFVGDIGVICSHGLGSNRSMFWDLSRSLSKIINVAVPDMMGHGDSAHVSKEHYNFEQYLNDSISVINCSGFKRIIWVGNSIGGLLGIKLAAMKNSPIMSLVLDNVDMQTIDYGHPDFQLSGHTFTSVESLAKHIKLIYFDSDSSEHDYMDFVIRNFSFVKGNFIPEYDLLVKDAFENTEINLWSSLSKIKCPILLVRSSKSKTIESKFIQNNEKLSIYEKGNYDYRIKYTNEEIGAIQKWIQKIIKDEDKIKSHLGIDCGSSEK